MRTSNWKVLFLLLGSAIALSACGGGSGGDGGENDGAGNDGAENEETGNGNGGVDLGSNYRLARSFIDLDNNGINEVEQVHSYNSSGQLISTISSYTDDGTEDLVAYPSLADISYEYDAAGNLKTYTTSSSMVQSENGVYYLDDNGSLTVTYEYDESGFLQTSTLESFNVQGDMIASSFTTLTYTNNRISEFETSFPEINSEISDIITIDYDENGLPSRWDHLSSGVYRIHEWNSNGLSISSVYRESGELFHQTSIEYNEDGTVDNMVLAHIPGSSTLFHTIYDNNNFPLATEIDYENDGSVEWVITSELENEKCVPLYLWNGNFNANYTDAPIQFGPGTGFLKMACS